MGSLWFTVVSVLPGIQTGAPAGRGRADLWLLPRRKPVQHAHPAHAGRHEPQVYYRCVCGVEY